MNSQVTVLDQANITDESFSPCKTELNDLTEAISSKENENIAPEILADAWLLGDQMQTYANRADEKMEESEKSYENLLRKPTNKKLTMNVEELEENTITNGDKKTQINLYHLDLTENSDVNINRIVKGGESNMLCKDQKWSVLNLGNPKSQKDVQNTIGYEEAELCSKREIDFLCLKCGAISSKEKTAKRHKMAHISGFKCSFCPQAFFMRHTATTHQKLHRGGDLKHVNDFSRCKLCGGSFISLLYLEFHIYESHGEDILKNHKALHLGPSCLDETEAKLDEEIETRKRFRCGSCNAVFMYSLNLEGHMAFHVENIYSCGLCDSSFSLLDSLLFHVRLHDDELSHSLFKKYIEKAKCQNTPRNRKIPTEFDTKGNIGLDFGIFSEGSKANYLDGDLQINLADAREKCLEITTHNRKFVNAPSSGTFFEDFLNFPNGISMLSSNQIPVKRFDFSGDRNGEFINPYLFHFLPGGKHAKLGQK